MGNTPSTSKRQCYSPEMQDKAPKRRKIEHSTTQANGPGAPENVDADEDPPQKHGEVPEAIEVYLASDPEPVPESDIPTTILRSSRRKTNSSPNGKTSSARRTLTDVTPQPLTDPFVVQGTCVPYRAKFPDFPCCTACIMRTPASGLCKFTHLRAFPASQDDSSRIGDLDRVMFVNSAPLRKNQREAILDPEIQFSTPGTKEDIRLMKSCIAPNVLPVLEMELAHEVAFQDQLVRRPREAEMRPLCDGCGTTIFAGHFICCCCGREICLECYAEWDDTFEGGVENIDSCSKKRRHTKQQMVPFSLFPKGEVDRLINDVKGYEVYQRQIAIPGFPKQAVEECLPCRKISIDNLKEKIFRDVWAFGEPLVVTGCRPRFKMPWTPEYFIENYGEQRCMVVDTDTDKATSSTVKSFFEQFPAGKCIKPLKLKDWPPADDFATVFPELFQDFENALPFPRFTRRHGFMNLASRFPPDLVTPDLGPKMYNAYASDDGYLGHGTTRLHLDMTDAVNIMVYATPNGRSELRGAAVWDIFPAETANTIREFLRNESPQSPKQKGLDDPIMRQNTYITTPQLKKLQEKHKVRPWRVYQNPGDAVFIPAGCAHQVCNLTACIKVAVDFVSPFCVKRCGGLLQDTRRLANVKGGKTEDVLQLRAMMLYAWEQMGRWQASNHDDGVAEDGDESTDHDFE